MKRLAALSVLLLLIPAVALATPPVFVTFCHVAGLAEDPANTVTLTLPYQAVFGQAGHFNENGTPNAGHEQDYLGECRTPPTTTTTTQGTTTTVAETTTTTVAETTTTTQPTFTEQTTTTIAECPPGTIHQPPFCVEPPEVLGATAIPVVAQVTTPETLPFTGINTPMLALSALGLILLGGAMLKVRTN